jgi:hypothetical protein
MPLPAWAKNILQLAILTSAEGNENSTISYADCMECCCQQPRFFSNADYWNAAAAHKGKEKFNIWVFSLNGKMLLARARKIQELC